MSSTTAALQVISFVRALALAWKNLAAYPTGHPALVKSLAAVDQCLRELRGPAGDVSFGIAADGIVYGDSKIDIAAAQKFAYVLYARGVAVLHLSSDTTAHDMEIFLRLLATRTDEKRPFGEVLTSRGVININVQSVHYGAVQVTDSLASQPTEKEHSVWEEILRALLAQRQFAEGVRDAPRVESIDELSRLIAEYAEPATEVEFDPKATFGIRIAAVDGTEHPLHHLLERTIGEQITAATGLRKQHSLEQAVQLIRTLPYSLRKTIIRAVTRALALDETAGTLLRKFASEIPSDDVLDALRYLSSAGQLSEHATSLLQSLVTTEASARTEAPTAAVVADLVGLFADNDVNRFNPAEYRNALSTFAVRIPEVPAEAVTSLEKLNLRAEAVGETMPQFTNVLFDMIADDVTQSIEPALRRIESVFREHIIAGNYNEALAVIEKLGATARNAEPRIKSDIDDALTRLAAGEAIHHLIERVHRAPPQMAQQIQRLAEALGSTAQRNLLAALAQENNRSRRRRLFDFIASLGPRIVPDAIPMLDDHRWYVVRNVIVLLRTVGDRTSLPKMRELAEHVDLRVRMEALKTLFAIDKDVPGNLLANLLNDPDAKMAEAAVGLVGSYGIREAVQPLLKMLEGNDIFGAKRRLRIKAVRALSEIGDARALPQLERFFRAPIFPWPSAEERYAAWESLQRYPLDARAPIVNRGLRSGDPQIRALCERMKAN